MARLVVRKGDEMLVCIGSWWGNVRVGDHWGNLRVNGWKIIGWISTGGMLVYGLDRAGSNRDRWRKLVSALMNIRVP